MILFVLAGTILALAFWLSWYTDSQRSDPFTQLWAHPTDKEDPYEFEIGIGNRTSYQQSYDLFVESGGRMIQEQRSITLQSGNEVVVYVALDDLPSDPIVINLYLSDSPQHVYRSVQLSQSVFVTPQPPIESEHD